MPEQRFFTIVGFIVALDCMAGLVVLRCLSRASATGSSITVPRLMIVLIAVAMLFVLQAPFLAAYGVNVFGLIYIAYLELVIIAPAASIALLAVDWARRRGAAPHRMLSGPGRCLFALAAIALPAVGWYATFVEPSRVQFERPRLPLDHQRAGSRPIRIGILADIQTAEVGDHEHAWIDRLMAEAPDIIVIPGDLLQTGDASYDAQPPKLRQ